MRRLVVCFTLAMLAGLLLSVVPAVASTPIVPTTVGDASFDQGPPTISGDRLVWEDDLGDSGAWRVLTWHSEDGTPTMMDEFVPPEDAGFSPQQPAAGYGVSGDRLAWIEYDGAAWQVYTWKVGQGEPLQLTNTHYDNTGVQVSGDRLVWEADPAGGDKDQIYTWKAGDVTPTRVTHNALLNTQPEISGDRIAWQGVHVDDSEETTYPVFTWHAGDTTPTLLPGGSTMSDSVQVSGSRVVWLDDSGVVTWSYGGGAPVHLTHYDDSWNVGAPAISGDRIAWSAGDDPSGYEDIYTWKAGDSAPTQLDTAGLDNEFPQVSGDRVVWQAGDTLHGGSTQIYTWEAGDASATQFTTGGTDNVNPVVDGERLAWQSQGGSGYQLVTAMVPATGRPVTTISGFPAGWSESPVTFSLAAGGSSPPFTSYYALNGGPRTLYAGPVLVSTEGTTTVAYLSSDSLAEFETTKTATIRVDTGPPTTSLGGVTDGAEVGGPLHVTLSAQDAVSGVDSVDYILDDGPTQAYGTGLTVSTAGPHTLEYWAVDNAGNMEVHKTVSFTVTQIVKQPCTISISASPSSVKLPKTFVLSGVLSGGINGNGCVVYVRKPGSPRWSYSSNRVAYNATGSGASWWYRYSPKAKGVFSFYVSFSGDDDHLAAQSKTIKVTVK